MFLQQTLIRLALFLAVMAAVSPAGAQISGSLPKPGPEGFATTKLSGQIRTNGEPLPAGLTVHLRPLEAGEPTSSPGGIEVGIDGAFKVDLFDAQHGIYEVLIYQSDRRLLHRERVFVNDLSTPLVIYLPEDRSPKPSAGVVSWEQLSNPPPSRARKRYERAVTAKAKGQPRQAIEFLQDAVEIHPAYPEAQHALGIALLEVGEIERAVAAFQEVVNVNPSSHIAQSNLGIALQACGRYQGAEAVFRRAVDLAPAMAINHFNLGVSLFHQGKLTNETLHHLETSLPKVPRASLYIAYIEEDKGQRTEAAGSLRKYLSSGGTFRREEAERWLADLESGVGE